MIVKKILILGAGGHARVLLDALLLQKRSILGILDQSNKKKGQTVLGTQVLGDDELLKQYSPQDVELVNGVGSIDVRSCEQRQDIYNKAKTLGFKFAQVIHPTAIIAKDAMLGEGTQVMAGAVVQSGSHIGNNVIINTGALIDHDAVIGDHTHIAPGVTLSGNVQIGLLCQIGVGAKIIQGIKIGDQTLIGAGAIITQNVGSNKKVKVLTAQGQQETDCLVD